MSATDQQQAQQVHQFKEFLQSFNKVSEKCFEDCVNDFSSRKVSSSEDQCAVYCLQKFLKSTAQISQRFQEHLQLNVSPAGSAAIAMQNM